MINQVFFCSLLTICFTFPYLLHAQEYQTIHSQQQPCFENKDGHIKCMAMDSVKYDTDSTFYPYKAIRNVGNNCFTVAGPSWIGEKIIVKGDSVNLFFNKHHDTIRIKTNAKLNESWMAYQLPDSLTITATITAHDTMHFLGLSDSVKTIGFQAYDGNMDSLEHELNNMELQLSKHYGWIKTFNFYLFPNLQMDYYASSYPVRQLATFDLAGLTHPDTGVQNLHWLDIYDFQPGDELHIYYESSLYYPDFSSYTEKKQIFTYLERKDYQDSVVYRYSKKEQGKFLKTNDSSYTDIDDTLKKVYYPKSIFDNHMPGEAVIGNNIAFAFLMNDGEHLAKTDPTDYDEFWKTSDTCWSKGIIDGCFPDHHYYEGLGGPYYTCDLQYSFEHRERKLVYYKKGQETWGNPVTFTGISNEPEVESVSIFPNPADEVVNIRYDGNYSEVNFEIVDLNGRKMQSVSLRSHREQVDISNMPGGFYLFNVRKNGVIIKSGKLVIQ